MQDIETVGLYIVMGLGVVLIWIWMAGRMSTKKLRNKIAQDIATRFQSITSKVSVKLLGNTGVKFALHQKAKSSFSKLEATVLLLDRSNAFHMLYCKVRHRTDQIQIRGSLKEKPAIRVEMASANEKQNLDDTLKDQANNLKEFKVEYLAEWLYILTNDTGDGADFFDQSDVSAAFKEAAQYLTRISIAPREPHLFISAVLVPQSVEPIERLTLSIAKGVRKKNRK